MGSVTWQYLTSLFKISTSWKATPSYSYHSYPSIKWILWLGNIWLHFSRLADRAGRQSCIRCANSNNVSAKIGMSIKWASLTKPARWRSWAGMLVHQFSMPQSHVLSHVSYDTTSTEAQALRHWKLVHKHASFSCLWLIEVGQIGHSGCLKQRRDRKPGSDEDYPGPRGLSQAYVEPGSLPHPWSSTEVGQQ